LIRSGNDASPPKKKSLNLANEFPWPNWKGGRSLQPESFSAQGQYASLLRRGKKSRSDPAGKKGDRAIYRERWAPALFHRGFRKKKKEGKRFFLLTQVVLLHAGRGEVNS